MSGRAASDGLPRRILLADADAFFVAVARLVDPDGAGKEPLLVVGGSATGRGVVTSASYETRVYGVRSGMPMAQALRLCPGVVRVPVPGEACREKSRAIRTVLQEFTPIVEAASIDEWYLDMTGTEQLYAAEPLSATAARIRQAVIDRTGVAVSLGGGTSKLIAKLAAKRAKPHHPGAMEGVCVIPPGGEAAFLATHRLGEIPGIGPKFSERLAHYGLRTVQDALVCEETELTRWFGERTGRWLFRRIRGVSTAEVTHRARAKSMSRETTFPRDLERDEDLERALLRLSTRVAHDLRAGGLRARTVTVKYREPDFTTRQASRTLPKAVTVDKPIVATAVELLRKLRKRHRVGARLLGVALSNLESPERPAPQLSLFDGAGADAVESQQDVALAQTVDRVNRRFGRGHLVRGSEVADPPPRS